MYTKKSNHIKQPGSLLVEAVELTNAMHELANKEAWETLLEFSILRESKLHEYFSESYSRKETDAQVRESIHHILASDKQVKQLMQAFKNKSTSECLSLKNAFKAVTSYQTTHSHG